MKKFVLALLLAAFCTGTWAQSGREVVHPDAFYGSFDLGAAIYSHNGSMSVGVPAIGLAGGCWISDPLAFQIGVDGVFTDNAKGHSAMMLLADAEFKWDVNRTFFHVYSGRFMKPLPFYPLVGMGLMWHFDFEDESAATEHSFQAMLGLQVPVRVSNRLDAKLEYKVFFLPQGFDNSPNDNFLHTISLGINLLKRNDPYHRRTEHETRSVGEDWFVGLGIGPNYSVFDIFTNENRGGWAMLGVAPEIMVGRNFSSFWTLRVELTGLTAHEQYDTVTAAPLLDYHFSMLHADVMVNVSNALAFKRGVKWNFLPYLGAGMVWRYDDLRFDMALDFGLVCRRYVGPHSDLFADLKYVMLPPSMAGSTGPSGSSFGVGIPSLTVGYIYNFGRSTTRYRQTYKD